MACSFIFLCTVLLCVIKDRAVFEGQLSCAHTSQIKPTTWSRKKGKTFEKVIRVLVSGQNFYKLF